MFKTTVVALCLVTGFLMRSGAAQAGEVRAAMKLEINGHSFLSVLESNAAAEAFRSLLPLRLEMSELNGNEKYHYLTQSLPSAPESVKNIRAGDIMLYGNNFCYNNESHSLSIYPFLRFKIESSF